MSLLVLGFPKSNRAGPRAELSYDGALGFGLTAVIPQELWRVKMDTSSFVVLIVLGFASVVALSIILGSFFTVETSQVAIVQRLVKFAQLAGARLNWKVAC